MPGFLVTGSEDRKVKIWNVQDNKPSLVLSRNLDVGRIFSTQFAPDQEVAFRLSVAGSRGNLQVWDTSTNADVRATFGQRVKLPPNPEKERLVGTDGGVDDDDDSEDEAGGVDTKEGQADGWESMEED